MKVNWSQSKEERRIKYALARLYGYNSEQANRMRDWRKNVLIQKIFYDKVKRT